MANIQSFVKKYRVKMSVEWADENPNIDSMPAGSRHFRCVLRCQGRRLTVPFSQGPAIEKEPTVEDILDCLSSDACSMDNNSTFEDWCAEYGYDTDSRKAEKTFHAVEKQTEGLRRLLPVEAFKELVYETERL